MSLVSQISTGRIGTWCAEHLAGLDRFARQVPHLVRDLDATRPPRQPVEYYAHIGGMWGQRLAMFVEHAPPYAALLGGIRAGLLTSSDAAAIAMAHPTHDGCPDPSRAYAYQPSPTGLIDVSDGQPVYGPGPGDRSVAEQLSRLAAAGRKVTAGMISDSDAEYRLLDGIATVTSLESMYRSGELPDHTLDGDVLANDWRQLADQARTPRVRASLDRLAPSASSRLGHAAPTIVPRWAEGDVLLGPAADGGYTLLDIKTVTRADDLNKVRRWLWQILGYAWLDTTDRWRIRRVGLWLTRHGAILTWPVEQLASAGGADRDAFLRVARRAITEDGGEPTTLAM